VNRALTLLGRNLFEFDRAESPGAVVFFKLFELFLVVFAVRLIWMWTAEIGVLSEVVLRLGAANYFDPTLFYGTPLAQIVAGLTTSLLVVGFFRVWSWAYIVAVGLLHLLYAVRYTQGEIPHSANLFVMSLLGLALATLFFDDGHERRRFTMGFTYFFIGLGYTLAAASKLVATGPMWADGLHLWMWIHEKSVDQMLRWGTTELTWVQQIALESRAAATASLLFGLVTEAFAWLIWFRRFRLWILAAIIGLHAGIYYSMQIVFELSFYQLGLLLLPLPALFDTLAVRYRSYVWKTARVCARYA
jgi:hypothetical protein